MGENGAVHPLAAVWLPNAAFALAGLILLGLATRLASVPLVIDMLVAIATTKLPMLFKGGFWAMVHEARTDWSMLLGAIFLLIVGGGSWSIDAWLTRERNQRD